jgi:hypothetical protein
MRPSTDLAEELLQIPWIARTIEELMVGEDDIG